MGVFSDWEKKVKGAIPGKSSEQTLSVVGGFVGGMPADQELFEKYSWHGLATQEREKYKSEKEKQKEKKRALIKTERLRPKTEAQEGVIDYTKLQKTLKQMQSIKGKAISPDIMKSLLGGAIKGQIEPAVAREERAMDRAIQQKRLDVQTKLQEKAIETEEKTARMGFVGDVLGVIAEIKTILCTELNRQGLLDIQVIERANIYRRKHISKEVYEGYLIWATPLVEIMKKSILVTKLVCLFWKPLTYELASRGNERKGNLVGKVSYGILSRLSRVVYFFNEKGVVQWQTR